MENKYYRPSLEEFYLGFEYERFIPKSNSTEEGCWEKITMSVNYLSLDEIDDEILEKEIRVKYLDKEDIESLGFKFYKEKTKTLLDESVMLFDSEKLNILLGYYYTLNKIVIITKDPSKNEIYSKTGQDPYKIAGIKIKNKSELIKLLKQLEIV